MLSKITTLIAIWGTLFTSMVLLDFTFGVRKQIDHSLWREAFIVFAATVIALTAIGYEKGREKRNRPE